MDDEEEEELLEESFSAQNPAVVDSVSSPAAQRQAIVESVTLVNEEAQPRTCLQDFCESSFFVFLLCRLKGRVSTVKPPISPPCGVF